MPSLKRNECLEFATEGDNNSMKIHNCIQNHENTMIFFFCLGVTLICAPSWRATLHLNEFLETAGLNWSNSSKQKPRVEKEKKKICICMQMFIGFAPRIMHTISPELIGLGKTNWIRTGQRDDMSTWWVHWIKFLTSHVSFSAMDSICALCIPWRMKLCYIYHYVFLFHDWPDLLLTLH